MGKNGTCTLGETSFTRSVSPGAFQLSLMAEGGAIVFYPVNAGIRWQSRFCLARKRNNITTTINQIRSVSCSLLLSSSVTLCSEGFSFTLFSVRNTNVTTLPPTELQEGAGGTEHLASGAQCFQHDLLKHKLSASLAFRIFKTNSGKTSVVLWPRTILSLF